MGKLGGAIKGYLSRTDKWLLLLWVGASALSVTFLLGLANSGRLDGTRTITTHIAASCLGLAVAVILSCLDYHLILKLWKLYLPLCLVLVGLTLFSGFSVTRGDNQAWLQIGFGSFKTSLQPSELLKISFITTFSMHLAKVGDELNRLPNLLLLCAHGGAHVLLIQIQGDSGTALIFLGIFLVMLFCAGIRWRYIAGAAAALVAAVPLLWYQIMSQDQRMRILTLLNPELNETYAYQQMMGLIALGRGGLRGTGIFAGTHTRVPEAYNDLIFSFIGEATGFIGALGVIVLLLVIAFKILFDSTMAKDNQGRFLCIGVFAMMIIQTTINLGMSLSLLPVIGVTLPLFSSGGTSVLSMYTGLGLVLSVYCHSKSSMFE